MDDAELVGALRPGELADDLLRQALLRGSLDDGVDTEELTGESQADSLARTYRRRARPLAERGLLMVELDKFEDDLDVLADTSEDVRVVVRVERGPAERTVFTALGAGSPWRVGACLVHRMPD